MKIMSPIVLTSHSNVCYVLCFLSYITFITHKNDFILSLPNFTEISSLHKFDNDYEVIVMSLKCYRILGDQEVSLKL